VGSQKESLMKLVREHFDTFVRSADSVEHFALAFAKVDSSAAPSEHAARTLPPPAPAAAAAHAGALASGGFGSSRRPSFRGSVGAQSALLAASVAALDRVDLLGLQELVAAAQRDARDAFGLLLRRGARLRAHKLARQRLAGWAAGVVDAPQRMAACVAAAPRPQLAAAVAHWRRVRQALAAAGMTAGMTAGPTAGPTAGAGRDDRSGGEGGGSASLLLRRVSEAAETVGLRVRAALQAELAAPPSAELVPHATAAAAGLSMPLGRAARAAKGAANGGRKEPGGREGGKEGEEEEVEEEEDEEAGGGGGVRTSRLLRAAALLVELGPGPEPSAHHDGSRRGGGAPSTPVAAPLPRALLPRRRRQRLPTAGLAPTLGSPPATPPGSPADAASSPRLLALGPLGDAAAAAEAARARGRARAQRDALARSPHLAGLLWQAGHLKAAAQTAARLVDGAAAPAPSVGSVGVDAHAAGGPHSGRSSSCSSPALARGNAGASGTASGVSVAGSGAVVRRPVRRGSLVVVERAARTGSEGRGGREEECGGDGAAPDEEDGEKDGAADGGKQSRSPQVSPRVCALLRAKAQRARAAVAHAEAAYAAAHDEARRNAKIQAKLKVRHSLARCVRKSSLS
jgi:hypothetical protein